jgi:hypothetical protein
MSQMILNEKGQINPIWPFLRSGAQLFFSYLPLFYPVGEQISQHHHEGQETDGEQDRTGGRSNMEGMVLGGMCVRFHMTNV